jgi:hypothetical protein
MLSTFGLDVGYGRHASEVARCLDRSKHTRAARLMQHEDNSFAKICLMCSKSRSTNSSSSAQHVTGLASVVVDRFDGGVHSRLIVHLLWLAESKDASVPPKYYFVGTCIYICIQQ